MVLAVEVIPDEDQVSRHIDSPLRWNASERSFITTKVFEFPSSAGEMESLIWRKYVQEADALHAMGCKRQFEQRTNGKPGWTYEGSITAAAGAIRGVRTRLGHGFAVAHDPEEGRQYHVSITVRRAVGQEFGKAHKSELRDELMKVFGSLEEHACEELVGAA